MKRVFLIAILMISAFSAYSQRKIKKVIVEEVGFIVNLNFIPIKNELKHNDLIFKITPISTSSLDEKFVEESKLSGVFEYSYYDKSVNSYFLKKRKGKQEKTDYEFFLEGIDRLLENEEIDIEDHNRLKEQILSYYDKEYGRNIQSNKSASICNPYYIGNKYMNTYKLEIANSTDSYKYFDNQILIQSGDLLSHPLSSDELISRLSQCKALNQNKMESLNRHNLTESIAIPPHSSVVKYFAAEPFDYQDSDLKISFYGLTTPFQWTVDKQSISLNKGYTFYEFEMKWFMVNGKMVSRMAENFFILKGSSHAYFKDETIFIEEEGLNETFEIVSISLYRNLLNFSRTSVKGTDLIDLEKNRREAIVIRANKIDELSKEVE